MSVIPFISDLRSFYYGGGTDAEYQFLLAQYNAGRTAAKLHLKSYPVFYRSGLYYPSPPAGTTTLATTLNQLRIGPLPIDRNLTIDRIGLEVTTAVATAVMRLGIYRDDATGGYPGTLVLDAGTIDASTTGFKEITISQALTPDMYWIGAVAQTAAPTVRANQGCCINLGDAAFNTSTLSAYQQSSITGALPSPFTTTVGAAATVPRVYVRIV